MPSTVDWNALAAQALDMLGAATFVLDDGLIVRAWNGALEALLGRPRASVLGKPWSEARGVESTSRDGVETALERGRRDATTLLRAADGRVLSVRVALSRAKDGRQTIGTIVEHRLAHANNVGEGDLWYEVSNGANDRFRLHHARGRVVDAKPGATTCYEVLQNRSAPCDGCPAIALEAGEKRTGVIPSGNGREMRLIVARGVDDRVAVASWDVDDTTLWALVEAKVRLLSKRSDLSLREQDVLLWLLRGRSPQDIATLLGIAPRTVKFHQANVLRKVGAESRADLLRLLF